MKNTELVRITSLEMKRSQAEFVKKTIERKHIWKEDEFLGILQEDILLYYSGR